MLTMVSLMPTADDGRLRQARDHHENAVRVRLIRSRTHTHAHNVHAYTIGVSWSWCTANGRTDTHTGTGLGERDRAPSDRRSSRLRTRARMHKWMNICYTSAVYDLYVCECVRFVCVSVRCRALEFGAFFLHAYVMTRATQNRHIRIYVEGWRYKSVAVIS